MKREHLPASFFVWRPNVDQFVETSGPPNRGVDFFRLVCRRDHEDILLRTAVKVSQKLVDLLRLVLLVTSQFPSRWNECFELVDEYYGGRLLCSCVE